MAQVLALDTSVIVSTVLEGVLYGFSVLMFIATIWMLVSNREYADINHSMVVIACLLFVFSTTHLAVDIARLHAGLVVFRDSPGGPTAWFANGSEPSFIFKIAVYTLQTALSDGVVIYRCYKVWRGSVRVIVLPLLLWLGVVATAIGGEYALSQPMADSRDIFAQRTGQWITAFYATTLACNLVTTGLLAYKLWSIARTVHRGGIAKPVLMVVIDAGALYSLTLSVALLCFVLMSNAQYIILGVVTPIIAIAFYMVILRVGTAQKTLRSRTGASAPGLANSRVPMLPRSSASA